MPKTPLKSARRRASWTAWTSLRLAHPAHEAEQNQKKRTSDVLPKPDNLIRYRHELVMPAAEAGTFRSWLSGQTQGAQGGGGVTHNHNWNVSAIDSASFMDA